MCDYGGPTDGREPTLCPKKHTNTKYTAGKRGPRYLGWVGGKLERWEATAAERMNGRMEED